MTESAEEQLDALDAQLLLEDAGEGLLGEVPERSTFHFKGEELRA